MAWRWAHDRGGVEWGGWVGLVVVVGCDHVECDVVLDPEAAAVKLDLHYNGEWLGVEITTKDIPMSEHDNGVGDDAKGIRATVVEELIAASVLCQVVGELLAFQVSARSVKRTTGIDAEELLVVLRSTYRQDGREVLIDENARLADELNDARVALSDALAERDVARAGSEPVAGEGAGEVGGGGGSEPPPLPSVPGPLLLAGMVAAKIEENHARQQWEALACPPPMQPGDVPLVVLPPWPVEGEGGLTVGVDDSDAQGVVPSHPELVPALDSQGLPSGYRCELCPRVLATIGGRNRHMTVAHHSKGLTREQAERQAALVSGDPGNYGSEQVGADGLVACGVEGCSERRSASVIERHRLSMHGEG